MDTAETSPTAREQELVAHFFAAVDGPRADEAYQAVQRLWSNSEEHLATTEPIVLTTAPPPDLVEARQSPCGRFQAVLRREHDILCLSLLLAHSDDAEGKDLVGDSGPSQAGTAWQRMDRLLDAVVAGESDSLLGSARLYLAKHEVVSHAQELGSLASRVAALLPPGAQSPGWWDHKPSSAGRLCAWELTPDGQERAERRILLLAPPDGDRELSLWAWSDGGPSPVPFTRHLKHAAKARYELRVYRDAAPVVELCRPIEDGIRDLQVLVGVEAEEDGLSVPNGLGDVAGRACALRADRARAATRIALLKAMRRAVEAAETNARDALDAGAPVSGGLVDDDRGLFAWFTQRLEDDVVYLDALYEGAVRLGQVLDAAAPLVTRAAVHPEGPVLGIVTALPEEFVAMSAMIDDRTRENVERDRANYVVGTMPGLDPQRPHRVVLTLLGDTGNDAAAAACTDLARSFGSVGLVLMVGIAAGVPDIRRPERHVRLGDVVVSTWGIVDYDHVVDTVAGRVLRQPFPRPSRLLAQHANWLASEELLGERPWESYLDAAVSEGLGDFARPPEHTDLLFPAEGAERPIAHPDLAASGHRPGRPKVHYGQIGSADRALRNATARDELAAAHGLRALEMEGKGIADSGFASGLEWLVVRGISDYGDSHTDNRWRKYASLTAAAYTRALLSVCPPFEPRGGHTGAVRGVRPHAGDVTRRAE